MNENAILARTRVPVVRSSLIRDLSGAGVGEDAVILVHASLSALGWVAGGAVSVIEALLARVGAGGTIVMPAHSATLVHPACWTAAPVPPSWLALLDDEMPAFDVRTTPTWGLGVVAELFRTWPGVQRSHHPASSFSAHGPAAAAILADHRLETPFGDHSPLARLYAQDATILLLGVDLDVCTILHFAEELAWPDRPRTIERWPIVEGGARRWIARAVPVLLDADRFLDLRDVLIAGGVLRCVALGNGHGFVARARALVDAAVEHWRGQPTPW